MNYIKIVFIWCIVFLSACRNSESNHTTMEVSNIQKISLEDLETLIDNEPNRFLNNPDSFLLHYSPQPKTSEDKEIYAYCLTTMAYSLRENGDHYNSIKYYERALEFINSNSVLNFDTHLYIYKPLAALYTNVNDNQKAIQLLEGILPSLQASEHDYKTGFINNLANAYIYKGDINKAQSFITNYLDSAKNNLSKALLFNTLSSAYELTNNTSLSNHYNKKAIKIYELSHVTGDTLLWYSSALTQYGKNNNSVPHLLQSKKILDDNYPNSLNRPKADIQLILANIQLKQKKYAEAIENYTQVLSYFSKIDQKYALDYKYTHALLGMAKAHFQLTNYAKAIQTYEWAIENDFRVQQVITSAEDQLRNNLWNKDILDNVIEVYQKSENQKDLVTTLLWCIELSKARLLINEINRSDQWQVSSLETKSAINNIRKLYQSIDESTSLQEKEGFQKQIKELTTQFQLTEQYFEKYRFTPSKKQFLQTLEEKKSSFYSYYTQQDGKMIVISKIGDHYSLNSENNYLINNIKLLKEEYFSNSPTTYNENPKAYEQKAKSIVDGLLPHIAKANKDIFVSLDGILYGLPFDALYDNDFLINDHNFAYINSFLLFNFLKPYPTSNLSIAMLYRSNYASPLPNLPYVNQEIENISKEFHILKITPGDQNDATIQTAFSNKNIIHIAAHTVLDSNEAPIIFLKNPISTKQLRFSDIKSPLVFLSACNTGSGLPLPSEGTESIQRVFLSKNIPSVISTYWFANDEAMLSLTAQFYNELDKSSNPIDALATAKRNYLSQAGNSQRNPWYWANINYTGIENEIGLKKSSDPFYLFLLFAVFICVAIITKRLALLRFYRSFVHKDKVSNNKMP